MSRSEKLASEDAKGNSIVGPVASVDVVINTIAKSQCKPYYQPNVDACFVLLHHVEFCYHVFF